MEVRVVSRGVEVDATVTAHVERRLESGLGRLTAHVHRVTVQLLDLNGPRGGMDKSCRIEVRLTSGGRVFAENTDTDIYPAIDRATTRVGYSASRALARTRNLARKDGRSFKWRHSTRLPSPGQPSAT